MPFDISNLNPGTWFPFPLETDERKRKSKGKKEYDEKVCIRLHTADFFDDLEERTAKVERDYVQPKKENGKINKRAPLQVVEYRNVINKELRNELLWDYLIVDWVLYDYKSKEKIPCTKEMKLKLMRNSIEFATYISDCIEILTSAVDTEKEEETKN